MKYPRLLLKIEKKRLIMISVPSVVEFEGAEKIWWGSSCRGIGQKSTYSVEIIVFCDKPSKIGHHLRTQFKIVCEKSF